MKTTNFQAVRMHLNQIQAPPFQLFGLKKVSPCPELNRGPTDLQSDALPLSYTCKRDLEMQEL